MPSKLDELKRLIECKDWNQENNEKLLFSRELEQAELKKNMKKRAKINWVSNNTYWTIYKMLRWIIMLFDSRTEMWNNWYQTISQVKRGFAIKILSSSMTGS